MIGIPYCTDCGQQVEGTATFCRNCGTPASAPRVTVHNQNQSYEHRQNFENRHNHDQRSYTNGHANVSPGLGGTLTIIMVLGILWGIGSLIMGTVIMALGVSLFYLSGMTVGAVCMMSGIFAFISCINIYMQKNHQLALVCCILGSVIAIFTGGVISGVVGIIFAFLISKEKYRFRS